MNDLERIDDYMDEALQWAALKQNIQGLDLPTEKAQIDAYIPLIQKQSISVKMAQEVRAIIVKTIKDKGIL